MELTVKQLSALSGVSPRTIRYYDAIGLLTPAKTAQNGYRIYGEYEINRLQQILFYRELDMPLEEIRLLLSDPNFDRAVALSGHLKALVSRRKQLDVLISNVEKTICDLKGEIVMSNEEKFEGFKHRLIDENEARFGAEIRKQYGGDAIEASNAKVAAMSEDTWSRQEQLSKEIESLIVSAIERGDPSCDDAQKACEKHKKWLCMFWKDGTYSKEAHRSIAEMYVSDGRFKDYYDRVRPGFAEFFKQAIEIYCK